MTARKSKIPLPARTPAFVSREQGAAELAISAGTWDKWVQTGLPHRPKKPAPEGSVGFLVQSYRRSEDFKKLSDSTKASYGVHLNRFDAAWGKLSFDLADGAVIALRDALAATPGMANHMLSVGRTLWN